MRDCVEMGLRFFRARPCVNVRANKWLYSVGVHECVRPCACGDIGVCMYACMWCKLVCVCACGAANDYVCFCFSI